jgi:hypothetical protein
MVDLRGPHIRTGYVGIKNEAMFVFYWPKPPFAVIFRKASDVLKYKLANLLPST